MSGITLGLSAAFLQSLSYIFSRSFFKRSGCPPWVLLVLSHVIIGLIVLLSLPWFFLQGARLDWHIFIWTFSSGAFYLLGQLAWLKALRFQDASSLVPLLGSKIIVLALLSRFIFKEYLSLSQWGAVFLAVAGILILNTAEGKFSAKGLLILSIAVFSYSLSDLSIIQQLDAIGRNNQYTVFYAVALSYVLAGILVAPWLLRASASRSAFAWRAALPFALTWLASILALYACFSLIGAVFGNIVQSMRGLISIGLGVLLARSGFTHLEKSVGPTVILRRLAGALAMIAAIILYLDPRL